MEASSKSEDRRRLLTLAAPAERPPSCRRSSAMSSARARRDCSAPSGVAAIAVIHILDAVGPYVEHPLALLGSFAVIAASLYVEASVIVAQRHAPRATARVANSRVGVNRPAGTMLIDGDRVGRFGSGAAAGARSNPCRAAPGAARARAARGDPFRQTGRRGAAPVLPGARRRARDLARARARVLQPAPGRGIPHLANRFGHAGRGGRARARRGTGPLACPGADGAGSLASPRGRLRSRRPRPHELPARRLGPGDARQLPQRHPERARVRRSARHRGPARGARRVPAPGSGRRSPTPSGS